MSRRRCRIELFNFLHRYISEMMILRKKVYKQFLYIIAWWVIFVYHLTLNIFFGARRIDGNFWQIVCDSIPNIHNNFELCEN